MAMRRITIGGIRVWTAGDRKHAVMSLLLKTLNGSIQLAIRKHLICAAVGKCLQMYCLRVYRRLYCAMRTNGCEFGSKTLINQYFHKQHIQQRNLLTLSSFVLFSFLRPFHYVLLQPAHLPTNRDPSILIYWNSSEVCGRRCGERLLLLL